MTPEKFVQDVREQIINQGMVYYKSTFESPPQSAGKTWQSILSIYRGLPLNQKEDFLNFIRLIMADSISNFFGILDGSSYLNENRDEVDLTDISSGERLNDYLQDIFLNLEQNTR